MDIRTKGGRRIIGNRFVEIVPAKKTRNGKEIGVYRDMGLAVEARKSKLREEQKKLARAERERVERERAEGSASPAEGTAGMSNPTDVAPLEPEV